MDPNCAANEEVSEEDLTKLGASDIAARNLLGDQLTSENAESEDSTSDKNALTKSTFFKDFANFWCSDYGLSIIACAILFSLAVKTAWDCKNIRIPLRHYTPFK